MKVYNYDYICECGNRITCDDDILFELRNRSNQSYMPVKKLSHVERKLGVPISGYDKKDRLEYTSKCCIKCKRPLPDDACLIKSYKIPIIGRRSSGKTVFSLAMNEIIPAINRTLASEKYRINIEWKDAYSKKETIFIRERKRLINEFRMGELPDPTRNVQKMPPINYIITNTELNMKVMFQFYDLPGESTGTNGRLAKDSPILRADAILFIVDWNDLGKNQMLEVGETHAAILNEYIHAKKKKTIPFLICITKGDLIFDSKGYQYDEKLVDLFKRNTLKKNRVIEVEAHNEGFDENVNRQRNKIIKDYFHKNHFTTLERLIGNIDEDYIQFFLVSSINDMIDNNSFSYDKWMPNRVEEPILYLMARYSLYPTRNYNIQYAREESFLGKDREPFKLWHTLMKKVKPLLNGNNNSKNQDEPSQASTENSDIGDTKDYIETTLYDTHEIKQGPYKSLNIEMPEIEKNKSVDSELEKAYLFAEQISATEETDDSVWEDSEEKIAIDSNNNIIDSVSLGIDNDSKKKINAESNNNVADNVAIETDKNDNDSNIIENTEAISGENNITTENISVEAVASDSKKAEVISGEDNITTENISVEAVASDSKKAEAVSAENIIVENFQKDDAENCKNSQPHGNPYMTILGDDGEKEHSAVLPKSLYSRKFGSDFIYLDLQKERYNTDKYEDEEEDYEINYAYQDKLYRKIQKLKAIRKNVLRKIKGSADKDFSGYSKLQVKMPNEKIESDTNIKLENGGQQNIDKMEAADEIEPKMAQQFNVAEFNAAEQSDKNSDKTRADSLNLQENSEVNDAVTDNQASDKEDADIKDAEHKEDADIKDAEHREDADIKDTEHKEDTEDDSTTTVFYDEELQRYCKRAKTYDELRAVHLKFTPEDVADVDKALEKVTNEIEAKLRAGQ